MASLTVKELPEDEIQQTIQDYFCTRDINDFVLVGDDETVLPRRYLRYAEEIRKFKVRDDDVWICTYPKAGTTWTQEMIWLLVNNFDYEEANEFIFKRSPFLEVNALENWEEPQEETGEFLPDFFTNSIKHASTLKSPRVIKTHLPFSLLPEQLQDGSTKAKIIYVVRNPIDTCVSFYRQGNTLEGWRASLDDFVRVFLAGKIVYGCFWKHVFGFWNLRHVLNMMFISFEERKRDVAGVIGRIAAFLGKPVSVQQMQKLCAHLSFESMINNPAVNFENVLKEKRRRKEPSDVQCLTRPRVKQELSQENISKLRQWIKENVAGTDFAQEFSSYLS